MKRVNFKDDRDNINKNNNREVVVNGAAYMKVGCTFQNDVKEKVQRDTSPRVCYSLESEKDEAETNEHNESNDFILVLSDNEQKNDHVTEIIDKWASCDSEEDTRRFDIKRKKKGRLCGISSQSSDSISSGTSIHTVIYQPPREKLDIMTIEEVEIPESVHEKSFEEIRKSFENVKVLSPEPVILQEDLNIPANKVMKIMKSFENMPLPEPPTAEELEEQEDVVEEVSVPPKTPTRTSSFHKAVGTFRQVDEDAPLKIGLDKDSPQSKSASSIPELVADEGYSTFPNSPRKPGRQVTYLEKSYIPEKSISNVDLTDTENNSLDETFGKMHEKVHSLGDSNDGKAFNRVSRDYIPADPAKYSRAYLLVSKAGDVKEKLSQFEKQNGNVVKSMPAVNQEYIKKHITDTSRVVIKNQEVANVSHIKSKLERCANKSDDIFDYCGAMLTKNKIKNLCKKVGHSKILSKMSSLQKLGKIEDAGFEKLNNKTNAENDYVKKYKSGDVDTKRTVFEPQSGFQTSNNTELPHFKWSQRFSSNMPNPSDKYTNAQKQNQFRNYYGYHPADAPRTPARTDSRTYSRHLEELVHVGSRRPIYHPELSKQNLQDSMPPASLPIMPQNVMHGYPPYVPPPPYRPSNSSIGMSY